MADFDYTNSGLLRANDRRRNDRDPTHQGTINIEGKDYWLSAWVNVGKEGGKLAGQKYFSIKARPKDDHPKRDIIPGNYDWSKAEQRETSAAKQRQQPATAEAGEFDDDIPL